MNSLEAAEAMPPWARLVPIKQGAKSPAITDWPNRASADHDDHVAWWANGSKFGVGWKMGRQADGRFLVAIDADTKHGGVRNLAEWAGERALTGEFAGTVRAQTGGGGKHFVFEVDPAVGERLHNLANLMPGVDIRSEAGQIVVQPTVHPVSGKRYFWQVAPWERRPSPMSDALTEALLAQLALRAPAPQPAVVPASRPAARDDTSPATYVREHYDWWTELARFGWVHLRSNGVQSFWRRPGKTDDGHSAVLHDSGAFVIFSTEVPSELSRLGQPTKDGSGLAISLFSFIAAYEFGGDEARFARHVAEKHQLGRGSAPAAGQGTADADLARPQPAVGSEYLPDEFWEARPFLSHIRQAAKHRVVAPDALLVNVLAVFAATIPPCYKLPAVVGSEGSLNYLACVVADSGVGKTTANDVAEELVGRGDLAAVLIGETPGSGEGMIERYLEERELLDPETDKKVRKKVQVRWGIHWNVDEGKAFSKQARREGSTVMETLCSAWSGSALGQANAASATWRRLDKRSYRMTATISVQTANAHLFHSEDMQQQGVTGRTHFAYGSDLAASRDRPPWPGPLDLPLLPIIETGVTISYPQEIEDWIVDQRVGAVNKTVTVPLAESQHLILRCKIAALFALVENRRTLTMGDWELAETALSVSRSIVQSLERDHDARVRRSLEARGAQKAILELAVDDRKEAAAIASLSDRLVARVLTAPPDDPWSRRKLARDLTNTKTRHRFEPALDRALRDGRVRLEGDHVRGD